jgi:hypothetical protein
MKKKIIQITFKNKSDFRNRIAGLWQDRKEDESYYFHFPDKETEEDFDDLLRAFTKEDQYCRFCLNPESILTPETCCTCCSALKSKM